MKGKPKIQRISSEILGRVIEHRIPSDLFLTKEGRKWVAVDNTTGDAWTGEFPRKRQAVRWLRGKFEVGVMSKVVVARPIDGITINTKREFLLEDDGEVWMFDIPEQAKSFLTAAGVEPEELRHMTIMENCGICRKCGSPLFKSLLPCYDYQCFTCDKDFCKFEQDA